MNRRRVLFGCFLAACAVQLAVPLGLVAREERTLDAGESFRFRAIAWDPPDPMRGRYVRLDLAAGAVEVPNPDGLEAGRRGYATIEVGEDGFARLTDVRRRPPEAGPWLRVRTLSGGEQVHVELPFSRYYMNEFRAPEAERAWAEVLRDRSAAAWVEVRVLYGHGVIDGLFLDGVSIEDHLRGAAPGS